MLQETQRCSTLLLCRIAWEQLTLAYENGIDRLWILNVATSKPMEYPISQFMDMAWNPRKYDVNNITRHTRDWCAQQFGESQADEAARILNLICKYNGRCTPEMLDKNTYSLENGEWQEVVNQYLQLEADALRQYNCLPASYHDAYRQNYPLPYRDDEQSAPDVFCPGTEPCPLQAGQSEGECMG